MIQSLYFRKHCLYSLVLFLLTFASCESDLPEGEWSKTPPVYHFSVDKQKIETSSKSLSDHLSIKTNADWTVSADASWISLSPSSGKGDAQISVSLTENTTTSDRTGMITARSLALDSIARVSVSQLGKFLNVGQDSLIYSNEGETKTVSISAEGNVSVTTNEPWITAKIVGNELSVSAESNISPTDRKGSVLVEISDLSSGALSHEISVVQTGKAYTFFITNKDVSSSSAAFSDLITLSTNDEWTLSVDQDWIAISATSGQGDANININVAENKTTEKRTATVSITGKYSGKSASVAFSQDGKYLTVDPASLSFSTSSDSKSISVSTDGVTTVTKEGDWFSVSQEGNTLTVTADKNIATSSRKGSITVALTELTSGSLSRTIEISQSAMTYSFSVDKTSLSSTSSASSSSFNISTNDEWAISSKESWISLSATAGSGDKAITVNLSENNTTNSRSGSIIISGTNGGGHAEISVSQEGKYLTVSPVSLSFGSTAGSQQVTVSTDGSFTTNKSDSWISVSTSGNTITISVEQNTSTATRSGNVSVSLTELTSGSLSRTIEISQAGMSYNLSVNETVISVGSSSASETFSISTNDTWTASSDATWATLSATSGSGDKTITVSVSANTSTSARSAKITIKGSTSGITKTITVSQEEKTASGDNGTNNGHEYVDLGLPSGLLWATCNLGAENPEDYGDYFAWGETTTKTAYDWSTSQFYNSVNGSWTKYNNVDNKIALEPEDDAARVNWGGKWRMPTYNELTELRNNCSWVWTTQNGINGYRVTSKINNNVLFLPASGFKFASIIEDIGKKGEYWSSSRSELSTSNAYFLSIGGGIGYGSGGRSTGKPIRPVCE